MLAAVSLVLLVIVIIFGGLALGFWGNDDAPSSGDTITDLAASGFHAKPAVTGEGATTVDVTFHVTNNSDETITKSQVLVQCQDDNGYVSAIKLLPDISGTETIDVSMTLTGPGNPSCRKPTIEFSPVNTSTHLNRAMIPAPAVTDPQTLLN